MPRFAGILDLLNSSECVELFRQLDREFQILEDLSNSFESRVSAMVAFRLRNDDLQSWLEKAFDDLHGGL